MSEEKGRRTTRSGMPGPGAAAVHPRVSGGEPGVDRRRSPRVRLPQGFMALIGLPDSGGPPFAVSPRDLSRTGVGFYHSAEMHPGTACTVTLRALDGELVMTHGRVVRRRPLAGRLFDVGVHFDREVDVTRFVAAAPALPAVRSPADAARARSRIAHVASSMQRMAEAQAPLDELFQSIDELVRICESARLAPDDDGPAAA